jgi:RNA polymerase sigma-70 factor (ECF subfamily)
LIAIIVTDKFPTTHEREGLAAELDRLEEKLLVVRAQQGQEGAFQSLLERHERPILYYLLRMMTNRDDALEASQEVWFAVFKGVRQLRSPRAFRTWLYRLAHCKVVDRLRRSSREPDALVPLTEEVADPEWNAADHGSAEEVHRALRQISPAHAEVLTLRFLEDLTMEEIAAVLECSPGTVKSRLFHAKAALRRILEKTP